jgi:hypothetical protein
VPDTHYQVLAGLVRAVKHLKGNELTRDCACLLYVARESDIRLRDELTNSVLVAR